MGAVREICNLILIAQGHHARLLQELGGLMVTRRTRRAITVLALLLRAEFWSQPSTGRKPVMGR